MLIGVFDLVLWHFKCLNFQIGFGPMIVPLLTPSTIKEERRSKTYPYTSLCHINSPSGNRKRWWLTTKTPMVLPDLLVEKISRVPNPTQGSSLDPFVENVSPGYTYYMSQNIVSQNFIYKFRGSHISNHYHNHMEVSQIRSNMSQPTRIMPSLSMVCIMPFWPCSWGLAVLWLVSAPSTRRKSKEMQNEWSNTTWSRPSPP